jgi:hypothetical protein
VLAPSERVVIGDVDGDGTEEINSPGERLLKP